MKLIYDDKNQITGCFWDGDITEKEDRKIFWWWNILCIDSGVVSGVCTIKMNQTVQIAFHEIKILKCLIFTRKISTSYLKENQIAINRHMEVCVLLLSFKKKTKPQWCTDHFVCTNQTGVFKVWQYLSPWGHNSADTMKTGTTTWETFWLPSNVEEKHFLDFEMPLLE